MVDRPPRRNCRCEGGGAENRRYVNTHTALIFPLVQRGAWMGLTMAKTTPLALAEAMGLSARGGRGGAPGAGGPPTGAPAAAPPARTLAELRALPAEQALASGFGRPIIDGYVIP